MIPLQPNLCNDSNGVMLEWLKRHAWKACIRQKRIPSSNLGHSARNDAPQGRFCKIMAAPQRLCDGIFSMMLTSVDRYPKIKTQ